MPHVPPSPPPPPFQMVFAERAETLSGGNFHGEYPAKALDYLAIAIHEIANMSERRLERLIHPGTAREEGERRGEEGR